MVPFKRLKALAFTFGLHGLLAAVLLLLPQGQGLETENVYQVSLAGFPLPAGTEGCPAPITQAGSQSGPRSGPQNNQAASPPETALPAPQPESPQKTPEPAPCPPEEKAISTKKVAEQKKIAPKPQLTRPAKPRAPQKAEATPGNANETAVNGNTADNSAAGAGSEHAPQNVGGFAAYSADKVDQAPALARKVMPDYPEKARRLDLQGRVVVRLVVDSSGNPQACSIHEANPPGYFEEAALHAARKTRFIPGKLRGQAVNTIVLLPFNFSLR